MSSIFCQTRPIAQEPNVRRITWYAGFSKNRNTLSGAGARTFVQVGHRSIVAVLLPFVTLLAMAQEQDARRPPKIDFVDVAAKAGLVTRTEAGGEKNKKYIIETTGSGAALFDYAADGWPDIFLVNGTTLDNPSGLSAPKSQLYHNNHDGTFKTVTQQSGIGLTGWGQGVCAGDYDNDGHTDLYVTFWG